MSKPFKPTESELEILSILWEKENATVRAVHEIVQKTKEVGYTTTLKLMQIMHEKGLVVRNETAKTHIYTPCVEKAKAQEQYVGKMIRTLFSGSTSELVLQALGKHKPTQQDLIDIKKLIEQLEKK
ncbi:MAG: BlaI/MecI/CopY family transcriptional regulator [Sediminibacterium sp.]